MSSTANLIFDLVEAAQAQKHVTVNETFLKLDALVHLAPKSDSLLAQPASPADGDVYILPPGKTGAQWGPAANHAIAHYRDGVWQFYTPREGFVAWIKDTDVIKYFAGAAWLPFSGVASPSAGVCDGRLTASAGAGVPSGEVTGATAVYFTPFVGHQIGLYDGVSAWSLFAFTELTLKLTDTQTGTTTTGSASVTGLSDTAQLIAGMEVSGTGIPGGTTIAAIAGPDAVTLSAPATATGSQSLTFRMPANTNLDVFAFANEGAVRLEMTAWAGATVRAVALAAQDGVLVRTGAATRRYLGTVRTGASAGQTEDSLTRRFIWNVRNRVRRPMAVQDATSTWTYSDGAALRQCNANSANQLAFVRGLNEDPVSCLANNRCTNSTTTYRAFAGGIGLDSSTAIAPGCRAFSSTCSSAQPVAGISVYDDLPGLGYHELRWLEVGAGSDTQTWNGGTPRGLVGSLFA